MHNGICLSKRLTAIDETTECSKSRNQRCFLVVNEALETRRPSELSAFGGQALTFTEGSHVLKVVCCFAPGSEIKNEEDDQASEMRQRQKALFVNQAPQGIDTATLLNPVLIGWRCIVWGKNEDVEGDIQAK